MPYFHENIHIIPAKTGPIFTGSCHGNFGPENFGPRDRNSTKKFHGIVVLSWNFSPPVNKCYKQIILIYDGVAIQKYMKII